jgi:hypothetical protein
LLVLTLLCFSSSLTNSPLFFSYKCLFFFVISVTTVESGTRALQYLGLDGGKGASNLKVIKNKSSLFCYLLRRTLVYLGKTEGVKPLQLWLWLLLLLVFMIK